MRWKKAPEELVSLLDKAMEGVESERRIMFGYPVYFVNKNMFIGIFENTIFLRLSEEHLKELQEKAKSIKPLEPMPGRPMKSYHVMARDIYLDRKAFESAIRKSYEYAKTLKSKEKKVR